MTRLSDDGATTFIILDGEPIYESLDIARICARHGVPESKRVAFWRMLERAGRALLDQRRLQAGPAQLCRIRQELQLGLRLAAQLAELSPSAGQLGADRASVTLSRAHLAALREGERRVAGETGAAARLEEAQELVLHLRDVYEAALDACGRPARGEEEAEGPHADWRATLTRFYTRELAKPWTAEGQPGGEAFLADCFAPLERGEDVRADGPALVRSRSSEAGPT